MAKSSNQKLKLVYLMQMLLEKTDENHPMTIKEMIENLENLGISAERKSLYSDLEALQTFGLDVEHDTAKQRGYYVGERDFELAELKLLVDSVQSSKFITEKKTLELIKKIEGLTSIHEAKVLQRQVYVRGRVKSMNESVYYNVDLISHAISVDSAITFRYYDYSVQKDRIYRKAGALYKVSPFALMWDDENYYMMAYDTAAASMKHYRVDKMVSIAVIKESRDGKTVFSQMDMSGYSKKTFGMFAGEEQKVKLRFHKRLAGNVIDKFGKDAILIPDGEEWFTISTSVNKSPVFYAWLIGFGGDAELLLPESMRSELRELAENIKERYSN